MNFKRLRDIVEKTIESDEVGMSPIHSDIGVYHLKTLAKNTKPIHPRTINSSRSMVRFTIDTENKIHAGDAHDHFHGGISHRTNTESAHEGYIQHDPQSDTYHYGSFQADTNEDTPSDHPVIQRLEKTGVNRSRRSRFGWDI